MTARGGPREFIGMQVYLGTIAVLVLVEVYFIVNSYILLLYT